MHQRLLLLLFVTFALPCHLSALLNGIPLFVRRCTHRPTRSALDIVVRTRQPCLQYSIRVLLSRVQTLAQISYI